MKWRSAGAVCLTIAVYVMSCHKNEEDTTGLSKLDHQFLTQAPAMNMNELYIESLMLNHYPHHIGGGVGYSYNQHRFDSTDLYNLARSFNVATPTGPDSAYILQWQTLNNLQGYAFDSAALQFEIDTHTAILDLYQNEANFGYNPRVRNYAKEFLGREVWHKQFDEQTLAGLPK